MATDQEQKDLENRVHAFFADLECEAFIIAVTTKSQDGTLSRFLKGAGEATELVALEGELMEQIGHMGPATTKY